MWFRNRTLSNSTANVSLRSVSTLAALACVASLFMLQGCYTRTVKSKGLGAGSVESEYRSNTAADRAVDWLRGEPEPEANTNKIKPTRRRTW